MYPEPAHHAPAERAPEVHYPAPIPPAAMAFKHQ